MSHGPVTPANVAGWTRVALAIVFVAVGSTWSEAHHLLAVIVAVAGVTDLLDGMLARKLGTVSDMGGVLDYTADKLFFTLALIVLVGRGEAPVIAVGVILGRDVLVTGMRLAVLSTSRSFPSRLSGKARTIVMFPVLLLLALGSAIASPLLWFTAALSVVSLVDYGRAFMQVAYAESS